MSTPEAHARREIGAVLVACGWVVQNFSAPNLGIGHGIALREVPLKSGRCGRLRIVNRKLVVVIKANKRHHRTVTVAGAMDNLPQDSKRLVLG